MQLRVACTNDDCPRKEQTVAIPELAPGVYAIPHLHCSDCHDRLAITLIDETNPATEGKPEVSQRG